MTKIKIQIKNKLTGSVLFEREEENNTLKDTLNEAGNDGADLSGADLSGAYLRGVDLHCINLDGAYLYGADLRGADLSGADLHCINLDGAYLYGADLHDAYLHGADIHDANLSCANLSCANLYGANLGGTNLSYANLRDADLRGTNLRDADIYGANLYCTFLRGAKENPYIPLACPSDGAFVGWKKIGDKWLVKLRIPEDAKRSSATTRKCRCDKAEVLAITDLEGNNPVEEIISKNYVETAYKVGEMVYPDSFDDDRWSECSNGIHFFINKQDAINY